ERGCRVKIVAGTLIADRRTAVACSPERDIGLWIIVARDPDRRSAGFPLIAFRPGFTSRFTGRRNCVGAPQFLAGIEVKPGDKASNSVFPAGRSPHALAACHKWSKRDVVAGFIVGNRCGPHFLSSLYV